MAIGTSLICTCKDLTLPDELVVPMQRAVQLTRQKAMVFSPWILMLELNHLETITQYLDVRQIYMLFTTCKSLATMMPSAEYWKFLIDHVVEMRIAFSNTLDECSQSNLCGSHVHPTLISRCTRSLSTDQIDTSHGGSGGLFDVNIVFDIFHRHTIDDLPDIDMIWDGFFDTRHSEVLALSNKKAFDVSQVHQYEMLTASGMSGELAFKQIFEDMMTYNCLSVGVFELFVLPVSQYCMRDILPFLGEAMTEMQDFEEDNPQVAYPLWCEHCKHTSVEVICSHCQVDLSTSDIAFDNPIICRALLQVCPTALLANSSRMYVRAETDTIAISRMTEMGTFSLDVTDGRHTMAINITEERFKLLVFHAMHSMHDGTTHVSSNPLAGAMLLVSLRVKDMHGLFVNALRRDLSTEPFILYQGPFQLVKFQAMNVEFVGWTRKVYEFNDVYEPMQQWGVELQTDETLEGFVFDHESLDDDSDNADEESAVAGIDDDSDGGMDVSDGVDVCSAVNSDTETESDVDGMDPL